MPRSNSPLTRSERALSIALLLGCFMWMARAHVETIDIPFMNAKLTLHNQVIANLAPDPYQYKLWTISNGFAAIERQGIPLPIVFVGNTLFSLAFLVACHHAWLSVLVGQRTALIGDLVLAALGNTLFLGYYHHPYEFWGVGFFCLLLRAVALNHGLARLCGWALATGLVWEKQALVAAVWGAREWSRGSQRLKASFGAAMLLTASLAIPIAVRLLLGDARIDVDGRTTLDRQQWWLVAIAQIPFVLPFLAVLIARFERIPPLIRWLWFYLPVLLAAYLSQDFIIQETRSFWPLVPIFTATVATAIAPVAGDGESASTRES